MGRIKRTFAVLALLMLAACAAAAMPLAAAASPSTVHGHWSQQR